VSNPLLSRSSQVKRESEFIEVEEMKVRVLSLDALIKSKKSMSRPRDKEAILQLEAIKELKNSHQDLL